MNLMRSAGPMELVTIGIQPGEMLLETIEKAIAEAGIRNGVVISGIGTLKTCHLHYITHTDFPPSDRHYRLAQPLELVSVSGLIADGRPHLHVVVSCGDVEVFGGHLEPESEVAYLAEIAILVSNDLAMARRRDESRGISLLGPK